MITNPEQDIQQRISESLSENDMAVFYEKTVRIRKKKFGNSPSDFLAALRKFGLDKKISDTKFIPECYLLASIDDRTELLRGLIDGDGYVHQPGAVEICTASAQMAKDIIFLAIGKAVSPSPSSNAPAVPAPASDAMLSDPPSHSIYPSVPMPHPADTGTP